MAAVYGSLTSPGTPVCPSKMSSSSPTESPDASPINSPKLRRRFAMRGRRTRCGSREESRSALSEPEYDTATTPVENWHSLKQRKSCGNLDTPGELIWGHYMHIPPVHKKPLGPRWSNVEGGYMQYDLVGQNGGRWGICPAGVVGHERYDWPRDMYLETDLDRVQGLFPSDELHLCDDDPVQAVMKSLRRKRSSRSGRLQRVLSAKGRSSSAGRNGTNGAGGVASKENHASPHHPLYSSPIPPPHRSLLLDAPVQMTIGPQSQERHFFLFSDLLVVAKPKAGNQFRLKEMVLMANVWLSLEGAAEVIEVSRPRETSFVIGWPTKNAVVTFTTAAARELWWTRLSQVSSIEKSKLSSIGCVLPIVITRFQDGVESSKLLDVSPLDTVNDCVLRSAEIFRLSPPSLQLWVRTKKGEAAYPLIGHEYPFAIERVGRQDIPDDSNQRCHYFLRNRHSRGDLPDAFSPKSPSPNFSSKQTGSSSGIQKFSTSKSPLRLHKMIMKSLTKLDVDSLDSPLPPPVPPPQAFLFGRDLCDVCGPSGQLPQPVMCMLQQLFHKGPFTPGIFRKSANAKQVRELKERLDSERNVPLDDVPILTVAVVFKDFLRSLPDCVLSSDLYAEWIRIAEAGETDDSIQWIRRLLSTLPPSNFSLLQHLMCVLSTVASHSQVNLMSAPNLAVCVSPSLLWSRPHADGSPASAAATAEGSKLIPAIIGIMIQRCSDIFGPESLRLFGDLSENSPSLKDSGAEESDSFHSNLSGRGHRRDDSSVDSLERESLQEDPQAVAASSSSSSLRRQKLSLTNLSRDSGLTMSDTQLYAPDDEETSSSEDAMTPGKSSSPTGNRSAVYRIVRQGALASNSTSRLSHTSGTSSSGAGSAASTSSGSSISQGMEQPRYSKVGVTGSARKSATSHVVRKYATGIKQCNNIDFPHRLSTIRRSASEESLIQHRSPSRSMGDSSHSLHHRLRGEETALIRPTSAHSKRPTASHGKGPAPRPPVSSADSPRIAPVHRIVLSTSPLPLSLACSNLTRSRSAHHLNASHPLSVGGVFEVDGASDEEEEEEITPQVSRSNSRLKETAAMTLPRNNMAAPRPSATNGNHEIYAIAPSNPGQVAPADNSKNINRTGSTSTVKSTDSGSTLTNGSQRSTTHPPSYEETITRHHSSTSAVTSRNPNRRRASEKSRAPPDVLGHQQVPDLVTATCAITRDDVDSDECSTQDDAVPPPLPPKTRIRNNIRTVSSSRRESDDYVTAVTASAMAKRSLVDEKREKFVTSVRIASPDTGNELRKRSKPPVSTSRTPNHPSTEPWRWESEEVRREITWSVPQLRALFGERTNNYQYPPPYRYPPALSQRKFHSHQLPVSQATTEDTSSGEESYV